MIFREPFIPIVKTAHSIVNQLDQAIKG